MSYKEYLAKKTEIQIKFLEFLENDDDIEENYQTLIDIISEQKIKNNRHELKLFIYLLSRIANNHIRISNFLIKIKNILQYLKNDIKNTFSNYEIFDVFKENKIIFLFCIQTKILTIDHSIYNYILLKKNLIFFQPEIQEFIKQQNNNLSMIESNSVKLENEFFEKRNIGENDNYICHLIREDLIEDFIIYVNQNDYPLNSLIKPSIYETNSFLTKNKPTLIEYAAFFGSIQIFRYLYKNGVVLTPSLWIYGIHGYDEEILLILEENKVMPIDTTYYECLKESIKCHHNSLTNYIIRNLLKTNDEGKFDKKLFSYSFHYYNFLYLPNDDTEMNLVFYNACRYDYYTLVELLFKTKQINLYEDYAPIKGAAEKNNNEILQILFNGINVIETNFFRGECKLKKMTIPSNVTFIEDFSFDGCSSLTQIVIPPSVKSMGEGSFRNCISLVQISIPPSIGIIRKSAFAGCKKLAQIKIPTSIKSIESTAFAGCRKVSKIALPSTLTTIGNGAFLECSSLREIEIPSSVTSIAVGLFNGCSMLSKITIPSSVTSIGESAFMGCSSLSQISIPNSVTYIGNRAFFHCSSLCKIIIPHSISSIGDDVFNGCTSLTKIVIPSSIKSIGNQAFYECSLLSTLIFENPSSLISIGNYAFYGCMSLFKISIPRTVSFIGFGAFEKPSLMIPILNPNTKKIVFIPNYGIKWG